MRYVLRLAHHGSVFIARLTWIAAVCVLDILLLLLNSNIAKDPNNMAGPEVSNGLNRLHSNYDLDWGWQESDIDNK